MKVGTKLVGGVAALIATGAITLYSDDINRMLSRWEGDGQNVVYPDRLARDLPTVCRGITKHTSPVPVIVGDYWSPERCADVERWVAEKDQLKLADCIHVYIEQPTFDALSSFAHNVGVPSACASRAVGLINAGRVAEGCEAMAHAPSGKPVWSYADGKFVRGLYNRRLAERDLCLKGTTPKLGMVSP